MKFTIAGSLGTISKPLAELLVKAGHEVAVISSTGERRAAIESIGAKAHIGSVEDSDFLTSAFAGADAVYTMVPPDFSVSNHREHVGTVAKCYVKAIENSGVGRVVNLSSIGAHLSEGTGPIAGMHDVEKLFEGLANVHVIHLRASYFYTNFYGSVEMIRTMNAMGGNYPGSARIVMVYPPDVSKVAAAQLQSTFTGKSYRYISGDDLTAAEVATVIGNAAGKDLSWIEFTDDQAFDGMTRAGMSPAVAGPYTEMGAAIRKGILWDDYDRYHAVDRGETSFKDFAREFAAAVR